MKSNIVHKRSGCYQSRYPSVQKYCLHRHCSTQLHCRRRLNHSWPVQVFFMASEEALLLQCGDHLRQAEADLRKVKARRWFWRPRRDLNDRNDRSDTCLIIGESSQSIWTGIQWMFVQRSQNIDKNWMDVCSKKSKYRKNPWMFGSKMWSEKMLGIFDLRFVPGDQDPEVISRQIPRSRARARCELVMFVVCRGRGRCQKTSGFIIWPG